MEAVAVGDARDFFAKNLDGFRDFVDLVGVEWHANRSEADNAEAALVFFDGMFAGDTGGKDDDVVAAFCQASGEVARKDGDAINHWVVEVSRDNYFHATIIPNVDTEEDTLCVVGTETIAEKG